MKMIYVGGKCNNHCFMRQGGCMVQKVHDQSHTTIKTIEEINAEIDAAISQHEDIFLYTPDMFSDLYYESLFLKLPQRETGYIAVNAGVSTLRDRMYNGLGITDILAKGIREIWLGVETGSEKLRKDFGKPEFSNEEIVHITQLGNEYGLNVCWYLMDTPYDWNAERQTYLMIALAKPYRVRIAKLESLEP